MAELEEEISRLITEYQAKTGKLLTIGTVESATGGRIADRITNVPGSSDYFKGSIVAYSNEVKIGVVGVRKTTIQDYGDGSRRQKTPGCGHMRLRYRDCRSFGRYSRKTGGAVLFCPGKRR
jgi:nicotinamide mononucleotide (NMN) deamidase PncC